MSKVLITGATGFLGGHLTRFLHGQGRDVVATGRDLTKLAHLPVSRGQTIVWNLADATPEGTLNNLRGVRQIVHCAALSSPWGTKRAFYQSNVQATHKIIKVAQQLGDVHLVFVSSPSVYFRYADQCNLSETIPLPKPVNAYAQTKIIAEDAVKESGVSYTIIRPRGLYGRGDTTLMPRLIAAARQGPLPLFRSGQAKTDITHVADVSRAIACILDQPDRVEGTVLNISGGEALPIKTIAEQACARAGVDLKWRKMPVWPALGAAKLAEWVASARPSRPEPRATCYGLGIFAFSQTLDLSCAKSALGWVPEISFEDGLDRTFAARVLQVAE